MFAQLEMIKVLGVNSFNQLTILISDGYIKKLLDGSNKYILTGPGEEVKLLGGIKKYISKKKWDKFISRSKDIIVTFVFPILTIYFAALQTCNTKIEIVKPVNIIVDSVSKARKRQIESMKNDTLKSDVKKIDSSVPAKKM